MDQVFALCTDVLTISQAIGRALRTAIALVPANSAFCWNPKHFNVAAPQSTQLTTFIGDAQKSGTIALRG
eukprot:5336333-Lingulodinium_polyedra.AAC.1